MSEQYAVPMYESERGLGAKIYGYAGPFPTLEAATAFRSAYNKKYNNEARTPDCYIAALEPVPFASQDCCYKTTVEKGP